MNADKSPETDQAPKSVEAVDDDPETGSINRRDALKKAGAASLVAGAVWAAPRIDGLSIVPDYASAGTATTNAIAFKWNSDGPGLAGGANSFHPEAGTGYNITQGGSTPGNPIQYVAPLGPAGNATMNLPSGTKADGVSFTGTVVFTVDPPFNKCVVTGGTFAPVTPAFFGDLPGGSLTIGTSPSPNTTSPITVPFTMPARPGNAVRVNGVTVTIKCN
jgi:hypothetical protein